MAVEKITKVDMFNAIADFIADTDWERKDEAIEFIDKQIEQLKAKAEKAKSRAEEKKVEGDELREAVANALTNEPQTIDAITTTVAENFDVTKAKVTARLTQLVKLGEATKEQAKIDGRKIMVYKSTANKSINITVPDDLPAIFPDGEPDIIE